MAETRNLTKASLRAGIIAGPLFLALATMLLFQDQAGEVIPVSASAIPHSLLLLALSAMFGCILAFPACLLAGSILGILASGWPLLRSTPLWLLAGGGIGVAIVSVFGLELTSLVIAFIATAIGCAAIVRASLYWE